MMDTHAYVVTDRPGAKLAIGIPKGEHRPALMLIFGPAHPTIVLARFYGEPQAAMAVQFMDEMTDAINRVIQHYADLNGDETT